MVSWRTKGLYQGLKLTEWAWLRRFNRKWDTKASGRSRQDAFDHLGQAPGEIPNRAAIELPPEPDIMLLVREIARFTVPRPTSQGWSIHLTLHSGEKIRAHFPNESDAVQAYETLREAFSIIPKR
jgi:hypothetical protein